jgi:DNA-binding transcriptional MerR regulator
MGTQETFAIGELATLAGISRRAVRYYVQMGLLPAPEGAGRGHYYTRRHLDALQQIRFWQEDGLSLDQIRLRLAGKGNTASGAPAPLVADATEAPAPVMAPEIWVRVVVLDGLEVLIKSGTHRVTPGRLARLTKAAADIFAHPKPDSSS